MKQLSNFINESLKELPIKGLRNTTTKDIVDYIWPIIDEIISECDIDANIIDLYVHGSRVYGNPREDSDIDVVLYYKGSIKEDGFYNILHDEDYQDQMQYDDIIIDINPIRDEEMGSLKEYIEKNKKYKKQ